MASGVRTILPTLTVAVIAATVPPAAHAQAGVGTVVGGAIGGPIGGAIGGIIGGMMGGPDEVIDKAAIAKIVLQLEDQRRNTRGVSRHVWGRPMAEIRRVDAIARRTRSLTYTATNLDRDFSRRYSTYNGYAGRRIDAEAMASKHQQWSEEANDNVLVALKATSAQAGQLAAEDADLRAIERMAGSAGGRMQALQAGNQFAGQTVRQVQKLRQLIMLNTQLQANHMQAAHDRDAFQAAASRKAAAHAGSAVKGERF
jgi:P-type conjugative transfer protein TrbJ